MKGVEAEVMEKRLRILAPKGAKEIEVKTPLRVLGIDLGTTNSTIAEIVWNQNGSTEFRSRCLEVEQNTLSGPSTHVVVPSAVALYNGKEWIGEGAKRLYGRAPELGLELTKNIFLECKNDMGSRRTYHRASEGYRSASEIGARVLSFLKISAEEESDISLSRTVVTVPASFQAAQRMDTVKAAHLAGIPLAGGNLLDEPVAAFLDYLMDHLDQLEPLLARDRHLLVFDFGGGTCDVAVFKLTKSNNDIALDISPLSVSRYHRLGGGDIDRAILHEVILPQLIEQNGLTPNSLGYEEKKNRIEPAFIGIAEALKVGLCNEIVRLKGFGQYDNADRNEIRKINPGLQECKIEEKTLRLQSPSITCAQFDDVLKPFLDTDLLYARETEYRLTCSVFAPIMDALDRSGLDPDDIDLCLLVGGSSLIPQVSDAVAAFFDKGQVLSFSDQDSLLGAVARGAAYHAFALQAFGRSPFEVKTPDRLSIRTVGGSYELIPRNTSLPYPAQGWAQTLNLKIPKTTVSGTIPLLVEFLAGEQSEERSLFMGAWEVTGPVKKGDALSLEYCLDENQIFQFRLRLADQEASDPFQGVIENPLSNVVNPHSKWLEIQENEESLRTGKVPKVEIPDKIVQIALGYGELQQLEKAISYLKQALRLLNRPDPFILNRIGIYLGELGDSENEEKYFLEAATAGAADTALFNLALVKYRRGRHAEARDVLEKLMISRMDGPAYTLAAMIAGSLGRDGEKGTFLTNALTAYGHIAALSDWELGWFSTAANMAEKQEMVKKAKAEQRRRGRTKSDPADDIASGILPEQSNVPRAL